MSEEEFDRIINVNLKSAFFLIKDAKDLLKPFNSNILINSSQGAFDPYYTIGVYNITKAGIVNMVKSLS